MIKGVIGLVELLSKGRMLVIECCNNKFHFHDEELGDHRAGFCPICGKALFVELRGNLYLIGEKVF